MFPRVGYQRKIPNPQAMGDVVEDYHYWLVGLQESKL